MPPSQRSRSRGGSAGPPETEAIRDAVARRMSLLPGAGLLVVAALATLFVTAVQFSPLVQDFLDFGAGVLALVSLTSAVMWGLVAPDRKLLYSEHRLFTQRVHRVLAVAGLAFLALHIWIKVARDRVSASAAALPFTDSSQPVLVGLGTLAGYTFVGVALTGAARSSFTSPQRSRMWRVLHMSAYLGWGAALLHGLRAGREAADWVTFSYTACVALVAVVLLLRSRAGTGLDGQKQPRREARAAAAPPSSPSPQQPTPAYAPPTARGPAPGGAPTQPIPSRLVYERRSE